MTDDCLPLPALTLGQIAELFPVHAVTVARWRTATGKNRLPDPDFVPAGNQKRALWTVETILVWASERGMSWDEDALRRILS
jgi:transposase